MIVSFKFYMMNFIDFVFNCYTNITSHVTQAFASCTHYTSYYLLNIVHVIVCVSWSDQPSLQLLWVFLCKTYFVFEILKVECLKILILRKLGLKPMFWKSISSHTHAFYSLYSMLWGVFFKNHIIFSKMLFFQNFDWSNLFFDQLKLHLKFFVSLRLFWSIETRESGF